MGPIWGRQDPVGSHVVPMTLAIWEVKLQGHKFGFYKKYEHKFAFSHTFLNTEMAQVVKTFLVDCKDPFLPHNQIPWLRKNWQCKRLLSTLGFPILVRWHLYIEWRPRRINSNHPYNVIDFYTLKIYALHYIEKMMMGQGSTLNFLAGCPKSHFLGWYRNFLVYWYLTLDNQVVNSIGWIWRADDP